MKAKTKNSNWEASGPPDTVRAIQTNSVSPDSLPIRVLAGDHFFPGHTLIGCPLMKYRQLDVGSNSTRRTKGVVLPSAPCIWNSANCIGKKTEPQKVEMGYMLGATDNIPATRSWALVAALD